MKAYLYDLIGHPKKYMIVINNDRIKFGASSYQDFTIHKDEERKQRYILRHEARENWTKTGIYTPGFWSRWLLWNKPTLEESAEDIKKRFNITIE